MSRDGVLARGRAAAEAGMVDACTIRRITGATSDGHGGEALSYLSPNPYAGKCRIQQSQAQAQREDIGEDHLLLLRLEVQLPVADSVGLQVGDEVTITKSLDPDLVGRVFLVHDLAHATEKTARRVQVIERTAS